MSKPSVRTKEANENIVLHLINQIIQKGNNKPKFQIAFS